VSSAKTTSTNQLLLDRSNALTIHLAEFEKLREEISRRSTAQWQLFTFNLTLVGTVGGFVLADSARTSLLALLTIVSPALGLLFLDHGGHIRLIGKYIDEELRPPLQRIAEDDAVFAYEGKAQGYQQKVGRWLDFLFPVFLCFAGPAIGSLLLIWDRDLLPHGDDIIRTVACLTIGAYAYRFLVTLPIGKAPLMMLKNKN